MVLAVRQQCITREEAAEEEWGNSFGRVEQLEGLWNLELEKFSKLGPALNRPYHDYFSSPQRLEVFLAFLTKKEKELSDVE